MQESGQQGVSLENRVKRQYRQEYAKETESDFIFVN